MFCPDHWHLVTGRFPVHKQPVLSPLLLPHFHLVLLSRSCLCPRLCSLRLPRETATPQYVPHMQALHPREVPFPSECSPSSQGQLGGTTQRLLPTKAELWKVSAESQSSLKPGRLPLTCMASLSVLQSGGYASWRPVQGLSH